MSLKPANKKLQLTEDESTLLLMAFEMGCIHIDTFNLSATAVFGMKGNPERHKRMMEDLGKLQKQLLKQLYEKKSDIVVPEMILPK